MEHDQLPVDQASVHHPDQIYDDMVARPRAEAEKAESGAAALGDIVGELR